jgi:hypothetical protein
MELKDMKPGQEYRLETEDGTPIVGALAVVHGCANLNSISLDEEGGIEIEYAGETEMYWDDQETVKNNEGKMIFVDQYGNKVSQQNVRAIPL